MDDRTFDEKTAFEWINIIEDDGSRIRENDLYPILRNWIAQASPKAVLDIGCGQGVCSKQINLPECLYTGLEPSPFLVKRAKELHEDPKRSFSLGSVYKIPFSNNVFDAAFSIATWHLLADLKTSAQELNRVLKPNGHFLVVTADPNSYSDWMARYTDHKLEGHRFEGQTTLSDGTKTSDILYLHTLDEIVGSLQGAGLNITKTEKFRTFIAISGQSI